MVVFYYGNNFYTKLQAQLDDGKTLRGAEQKGLPDSCRRFSWPFVKGITNQKLAKGISHYCGNEIMTWLDLADDYFQNNRF